MMSPEEYTGIAGQIQLLAMLALSLDLKGFLEHIEIAEGLGPLLLPTEWRDQHSGRNLEQWKALAAPLHEFQLAAEKLRIKGPDVGVGLAGG